MVEHTVIFKIIPGTTPDKIKAMTEALEALRSEIPQLLEMHAGINFSERNKGFGVMLVSRFRSKEDLEIYAVHPAHRRVIAEYIQPIREDIVVGDLEY
jgi:hypothetical protein